MASRSSRRANAYWTALVVSTSLAVAGLPACRDRTPRSTRATAADSGSSASTAKGKPARSVPSSPPAPPPVVVSASEAPLDPDAGPLAAAEIDLGTVAPTALGPFGAAIVKGDDEVVIVPFRNGKLGPAPEGVKTTLASWPVLVEGAPHRMYWASKGRLLRRKISPEGAVGALEVLATDVSERLTRVSAAHDEADANLDVVLYIGAFVSKEKEHRARLWLDGRKPRTITPEGAGATDTHVLPIAPGRVALLSVDARLALSPFHARFLELGTEPRLGEDRVVHVAGPAEGDVELTALRIGGAPVAFAPITKEALEFGLLSLAIGDAESEAPATWTLYPNGITPSPVQAAIVCGKPTVAFVQPENAKPGANAVVRLATVDATGRLSEIVSVASAPKIVHLAIAPVTPRAADAKSKPIGALLAYSTETYLKARALPCR